MIPMLYPKKWKGGTGLSNKGSLLLILIAGAVVYYFAIHRRRK